MTKNYHWHRIAGSDSEIHFNDNGISIITLKEKRLCIAKFRDKWHGFAYTCPHAGGILAEGYIDVTGNIVCPTHGYKFNLQNGRNTSGEGFFMKTFPVEVRPDGIYVGIESSSGAASMSLG